jgi:hypothetical protein
MGYCRHRTRTSVRPKFFLSFLFFWDPHVGSSWRFFHFLSVFCNLEKYLCAMFQVKWSENEGGGAIWRLFFLKSWSKNCIFGHFFKKTIHSLTILLETLHKGTSQGCKKHSKNEKIVKNYQREDPKKTKSSKKISDVRTYEYGDDNTPSGLNSAG